MLYEIIGFGLIFYNLNNVTTVNGSGIQTTSASRDNDYQRTCRHGPRARPVASPLNNSFNSGGTLTPNFVSVFGLNRQQSRQCAHAIGWRGVDRRRARRLSDDDRVPRPHA
jgi:hypothetical protein